MVRSRRRGPAGDGQGVPAAVTLAWIRYFLGRSLQFVGMLFVTGAAVLFFGAPNAERRMLAFTGLGAVFFVVGWLLAKKRPEGAR